MDCSFGALRLSVSSWQGLQERVLHPDIVAYTLKGFEEELANAIAARRQDASDLRRQAAELERGIENQLRALSDGYSPAISGEIARLEQQLAAVRDRLKATDPVAAKIQTREARRFVERKVSNLAELWDGDPRIAREEIAKHVGNIILRPVLRSYIASGIWNWLGVPGRAAVMVVPGARIACNSRALSLSIPFHIEVAA